MTIKARHSFATAGNKVVKHRVFYFEECLVCPTIRILERSTEIEEERVEIYRNFEGTCEALRSAESA